MTKKNYRLVLNITVELIVCDLIVAKLSNGLLQNNSLGGS